MKIINWTIKIKWEDGSEEFVDDIPNFVASNVDPFLDKLEQMRDVNEELGTSPVGKPTEIKKLKK